MMMFKNNYPAIIYIILLITGYCKTEDEQHKRVPSGFTGVRSKKSIPNEGYGAFNEEGEEQAHALPKNYESFFENAEIPEEGNFALHKRVLPGFFGMRGKKPFPEDMYKRAPMGFIGSRGKKAVFNDGDAVEEYPKRAQMGFFGMRGKKDFETASNFVEDKRAPSGFFGMRGKKHPSGFFAMRGKKYPYEFRGKFVGVRGKKSNNDNLIATADYYPDLMLGKLQDGLDLNQLMLLLTEQDDIDSSR